MTKEKSHHDTYFHMLICLYDRKVANDTFIFSKLCYNRRESKIFDLRYFFDTGGLLIMAITKDMSIIDIVQQYPDTVEILMNAGMGCLGCAASHFENIEQGAMAHGIDIDELINALNKSIGETAAAAE
jgi:hydrid cluster protein-associated redox disulfide domain